uniref:Tectonic-1-3 N-terminal domain-containing protein n=1 Tax=Poecilia reticulata TaxID=8081 RepID=A0A3P9QIV8_POERE
MIISRLCSLHVLLLCGRLSLSAADLGFTDSTISSQTNGDPFGSPTPVPGVKGASEEATLYPTLVTETPSPTTDQTPMSTKGDPQICLCDLTPGFCDIGCCCDTADCDVANLSTVFTDCPKEDVKQVCIEKWLMFRANVDSSLITVTDTLFCVHTEGKWIK